MLIGDLKSELDMMNRVAYTTGAVVGALLFFGPVIRKQNILWRAACATFGGVVYYKHMNASAESIYDSVLNDAYKRYCIENGLNYHMFD